MAMNGVWSGYDSAVAVTTSDTTLQSYGGFLVSVGGTVSFQNVLGTTVQITAVAGYIYPISVHRIMATGTAATGIVGLQ
jgi:hypothetical protein